MNDTDSGKVLGEGMDEMDAQLIHEDDRDAVTEGQRRINLIWETTQAIIAVGITGAMIFTSVAQEYSTNVTLTNAFFLIIGFYFSRTNHTAIGGTGRKPQQAYKGR